MTEFEIKKLRILINGIENTVAFKLFDESEDDPNKVMIEFELNNKQYRFMNDNYFSALIEVRKELENSNMQICCCGSAKNVYPSVMQLSMGTGSIAYKLYLGQKAKMIDTVNIFDYNKELEYVTIKEQKEFYDKWLKSLQ